MKLFHPAWGGLWLPWLVLGVALIPFSLAGYFFDDIYNSTLPGYLIYRNQTISEFIYELLQTWLINNGRLYPIGIISGYLGWDTFQSLSTARTYQIGLALTNVVLWYSMILRVSNNRRVATIFVLMLAGLFQFNPRWDGLSSFTALNQLVLLFSQISFIFLFNCYSKIGSQQKIFLMLALVFVVFSLLTYETGLIAWIGCVLIVILRYKENSIFFYKAIVALLLIILIYFGLNFYLRSGMPAGYNGTQAGELGAVFFIFLSQLGSAFPLAFINNRAIPFVPPEWLYFTVLSVVVFGVWWCACRNQTSSKNIVNPTNDSLFDKYFLISQSIIVLIFPSLLIGISARYQKIVTYGDPYIVVYLGYFGSAYLFALFIDVILRRFDKRWVVLFFSVIMALITSITILTNFNKIEAVNTIYKIPRQHMEQILSDNFMENVPEDAVLIVDSPYVWETSDDAHLCSSFFSKQLSRKINCRNISHVWNKDADYKTDNHNKKIFILQRIIEKDEERIVLKGNGEVRTAQVKAGKILSKIERKLMSSEPVLANIGNGFYGWEHGNDSRFAWASGPAEISFFNFSEKSSVVNLRFDCISAVTQNFGLYLENSLIWTKYIKDNEPFSVNLNILLPPGSSKLKIDVNGKSATATGDPRLFSFRVWNFNLGDMSDNGAKP